MQIDWNFVSNNVSPMDLILFFQPSVDDTFELIENHWNMSHIMTKIGIFPSVSQARKNGWNIPIPDGFWTKRIGKKKIQVTILNKVE
jgi:hypothetical protein